MFKTKKRILQLERCFASVCKHPIKDRKFQIRFLPGVDGFGGKEYFDECCSFCHSVIKKHPDRSSYSEAIKEWHRLMGAEDEQSL